MAEQHRDKDQQNYLIDQARTICDEIEVAVFGPSGAETPPCAEAWSTAKLIAKLSARVEALEADRRTILGTGSRLRVGLNAAKPDSSLVERVEDALDMARGDSEAKARAAIREVAAWLGTECEGDFGSGLHWAIRLEQEAMQ